MVLQAAVNAFDQLIATAAQTVIDLLNFLSFETHLATQVLETTLNNIFQNVMTPVVNSINRIVSTVATVIGDVIGAFNPQACCGTTAMNMRQQYCNSGKIVNCQNGVGPDGKSCL